jgi:hypothetical protein
MDFRPESWRGAPGRHRVAQTRTGLWWWVAPSGEPGLALGVQRVRADAAQAAAVALQLEDWRFNLGGPGSPDALWQAGFDGLATLEISKVSGLPMIRKTGARLPDVFDPRWPEACHAGLTGAERLSAVAGYVTDTDLAWAQAEATPSGRPTLLQLCLALEPSFAAYHAAWEFILAPRGGDLATLARDWEVPIPNRHSLRELTMEERPLSSRGYRADHARFSREFARRYFQAIRDALRRADPQRLLLGPIFSSDVGGDVLEVAAGFVDVLLCSERVPVGAKGPVLICDFNWSRRRDGGERGSAELSPLEQMHRSGRAALEELLQHPQVIGYCWSDHRQGDRTTQAPFGRGLLYEDGTVAHEHAQPLAAINARAVAMRKAAGMA